MSPLRSPRDTRRTFPRYLPAVSIRRGRDIGGLHFEIGDDLALVGEDGSGTGFVPFISALCSCRRCLVYRLTMAAPHVHGPCNHG